MLLKKPRVKQINGVVAVLRDDTATISEEIVIGMAQFMGRFFLPSSSFIQFVGNNSVEQCRQNAECVLSSGVKVELIIAMGPLSAQALAYVRNKTGSKKPTIFLNVQDPIATGLVSSDKKSDMFFGLVDTTPPEDYLMPLPTLLPDVRHAVVVYYRGNEPESTEREQEGVRRFLNEHAISYTPLSISSLQNLSYRFRQGLKEIQENEKTVVIVMPHMMLMNNMSLLSRMASSHDVVLYSLETAAARYEYDAVLDTKVDSCSFGHKVMSHALDSIDAPQGVTRRMMEYPMKRSIMIQRNTKMSFPLFVQTLPYNNNVFWI